MSQMANREGTRGEFNLDSKSDNAGPMTSAGIDRAVESVPVPKQSERPKTLLNLNVPHGDTLVEEKSAANTLVELRGQALSMLHSRPRKPRTVAKGRDAAQGLVKLQFARPAIPTRRRTQLRRRLRVALVQRPNAAAPAIEFGDDIPSLSVQPTEFAAIPVNDMREDKLKRI